MPGPKTLGPEGKGHEGEEWTQDGDKARVRVMEMRPAGSRGSRLVWADRDRNNAGTCMGGGASSWTGKEHPGEKEGRRKKKTVGKFSV